MLHLQRYLDEAKLDYPNRVLSAAQGRPASGGRTIASVREKDTYGGD